MQVKTTSKKEKGSSSHTSADDNDDEDFMNRGRWGGVDKLSPALTAESSLRSTPITSF